MNTKEFNTIVNDMLLLQNTLRARIHAVADEASAIDWAVSYLDGAKDRDLCDATDAELCEHIKDGCTALYKAFQNLGIILTGIQSGSANLKDELKQLCNIALTVRDKAMKPNISDAEEAAEIAKRARIALKNEDTGFAPWE